MPKNIYNCLSKILILILCCTLAKASYAEITLSSVANLDLSNIRNQSLVKDSDDVLYLYAGYEFLNEFQFKDGVWKKNKIDESPGTGSVATVAMDSFERKHVLYFEQQQSTYRTISMCNENTDCYNINFKYAYEKDGEWIVEYVPNDILPARLNTDVSIIGTVSDDVGFSVDSEGNPHIAYFSTERDDVGNISILLVHAWKHSGQWYKEILQTNPGSVLTSGNVFQIQLSFDLDDVLHIVYPHIFPTDIPAEPILYLARKIDNDWVFEEITDVKSYNFSELKFDSLNQPSFVGFKSGSTFNTRAYLIVKKEGQWEFEKLSDLQAQLDTDVSFEIDNADNIHVSFAGVVPVEFGSAKKSLIYVNNASGFWEEETLVEKAWSGLREGLPQNLVIDNLGNVNVIFQHRVLSDEIVHVKKTSDSTSTTILTEGGDKFASVTFGEESILTSDINGGWHLTSTKRTGDFNPKLVYIKEIDSTWLIEDISETFFYDGTDANVKSIAIDKHGFAHIVFFGRSGVNYVTNQSGDWVLETIDNELFITSSGSADIVIDSDEVVHIAYSNGLSRIKYVKMTGARTIQTIFVPTDSSKAGAVAKIDMEQIENTLQIVYPLVEENNLGNRNTNFYLATLNNNVWGIKNILNQEELDTSPNNELTGFDFDLDYSGNFNLAYQGLFNCPNQCFPTGIYNFVYKNDSTKNKSIINDEVIIGDWSLYAPKRPAITVSKTGNVFVSYFSELTQSLEYGKKLVGQNWELGILDVELGTGFYSDIFADDVGNIGVSYFDKGTKSLKLALITEVDIENPNSTPSSINDSATTSYQTAITINVLSNDSDSDGSLNADSVTIASSPANGTAEVLSDGQIRYTPNAGYSGTDTLQYTVEDNNGAVSQAATVSITVRAQVVTTPITPPPSDSGGGGGGSISLWMLLMMFMLMQHKYRRR